MPLGRDQYSTLLVELERSPNGSYQLRTHVVSPGTTERIRVGDGGRSDLTLDPRKLSSCEDIAEYRRELTNQMAANAALQNGWNVARTMADSRNLPVRVRVNVARDAPELHRVKWELLGTAGGVIPPLCGERFSISRFFPLPSPRALRDPAPQRLRVVVALANPRFVKGRELELHPIDMEAQTALARSLFDQTRLTVLRGTGEATLERIVKAVETGCDILYLVCHGTHREDRPKLYLESNTPDEADVVDADLFAQRITSLISLPPRLITFASCQSGGGGEWSETDDDGFLCAVAPRLLDGGVPAVIGMQGKVTQETAGQYYRNFFGELLGKGQIEGAASVASLDVQGRADAWMPVLLLALDSGRLWNRENVAPAFPKWGSLVDKIRANDSPKSKDRCTLILGSEMISRFSNTEFARFLTQRYSLPLEAREGEELARVAQYIKISEREENVQVQELKNFLRERVADNSGMMPLDHNLELSELISTWGRYFRDSQSVDPYAILAALPFPLIVTTNPDNLMSDALRQYNKVPRVECCPWKKEYQEPDPDMPTSFDKDHPLVYHLFGHLDDLDSVALTEDDFFDHLIWLSEKRRLLPAFLLERLCDSNLLFLGFRVQDWEFRVLQRTIAKLGGSILLRKGLHVAVQIDPSDAGTIEPKEIRERLERIFGGAEFRVNIFWGTVEEFAYELNRRWQGTPRPQATGGQR